MKLEARRVDSLPRLAWCARLSRGSDAVVVHHGPWVETSGGMLFEGAWDAPWGTRPDEASCLVGTALRCDEGAVVFASGSNAFDRLYLTRVAADLLVSNSLVFLLVQAGDEPDAQVTSYGQEFWDQSRAGIRRSRRSLRMRRGEVTLQECANLLVTPDLAVRRVEKPAGQPPLDFEGYFDLLNGTVARVLDHAADSRRCRPHRPVATLSRGFDSPAVAALAARHGCREAICFTPWPDQADSLDDATPIGDALGLDVHVYPPAAYAARPGLPEAEFCACPPALELPLAGAGAQLEGAVLLTGARGDIVWSTEPRMVLPDLRIPPGHGLSGFSLGEFRLRAGILHFAPATIGFQHAGQIHGVSTSEEMRPWRLGGHYDRPIPRRIAEEAGLPRGLFALRKRAGGHRVLRSPEDLTPASRADYLAFFASLRIPRWRAASAALLRRAYRVAARATRAVSGARAAPGTPVWAAPRRGRRHRSPLVRRYLFHWGFRRVAPRYRIPPPRGPAG